MEEKRKVEEINKIENEEVTIQSTDIDINREEENPGVGYEIVITP